MRIVILIQNLLGIPGHTHLPSLDLLEILVHNLLYFLSEDHVEILQYDLLGILDFDLLENPADSGVDSYIIQEDYIVGDMSTDTTAQNELFESEDEDILDFSESNPFGDAGRT